MKARHDFETDEEYYFYLKTYFAGQILSSIKPMDIIDWEEKTTESLDCTIVNFVEQLIIVIKL